MKWQKKKKKFRC